MRKLQLEHKLWVDREFANQPPEHPAAGCVEEAGELLHAVLKMQQKTLHGDDPRYVNLQADLVDAVGDCAIYCCSFCNSVSWQFDALCMDAPISRLAPLLDLAVALVQAAANAARKPYVKAAFASYISVLKAVCEEASLDFEQCVRDTWEKVKRRDRSRPKPKYLVEVHEGSDRILVGEYTTLEEACTRAKRGVDDALPRNTVHVYKQVAHAYLAGDGEPVLCEQ